ncbi:hypothetical protein L3V23_01845 [Vibrio sp. A1-b2]|uniref:hypothetical protein n=1 Tax=Vibrio sp. A1-b2 TaxID=2912248 RepID=UPI001F272D3E|nr:hypothetical protein [Vibrio sp. A1-b2]MCF7360839.1 hypothetical protein [Vibrio sp. A1-b2]
MTNKDLLDSFGKLLMSEVRDEAIEKYEMIAQGKIRSKSAQDLNSKLSKLDDEQLSLVREVVVSSVDDVLHNLLWMIEQSGDQITLTCNDENNAVNIHTISDGLSGEMYTEDGWIAKYSRYKENY